MSPRDVEIKNEYLKNELSLRKIGVKHGLSPERIRQILLAQGVELKRGERRLRTRKRLTDEEPLSRLHIQIGQDVAYRRNQMGLSPVDFAKYAKMSKDRLRAIELGVCEVTLSELMRLSEITQTPIENLMKLRTVVVAKVA